MNDDFIYKSLPKVPTDFAQSLYARISTSTPTLPQPSWFPRIRSLRRRQVALVILGLILMVAWTQINLWIRYLPIGELWLVEIAQATQNAPGVNPVTVFVPTSMPTAKIWDGTSTFIPEGSIRYLYFPTWIPDGFSEIEFPMEWKAYEATLAMWNNDTQQKIRLFQVPIAGGMHPYAPAGMYEEVQVKGLSAILIHGRFTLPSSKNPNAQRKWDETLGLQLHWILDKDVYTLETFGLYVSERDLIRMAESMKIRPWSEWLYLH